MAFIRIRHPDVAGEAAVAARALPFWQSKGWHAVDEPPAPEPDVADGDNTPPTTTLES